MLLQPEFSPHDLAQMRFDESFSHTTPTMSLKLPQAPNAGLFKQGYQSHTSEDGAVIRNIEAVREISSILLTSMGPSGRSKIVVNKLGRIFVTNDAATMLNELEIVHPVVKILIMASKQQEFEMGDNTNLVIILAGEFLNIAEKLLVLGLKATEIIQGYSLAGKFVSEALENCVVDTVGSITEKNELLKVIKPVIAAKQYGFEDVISELVVNAVQHVLNPKFPGSFNVDSIRVVKIMGSSLSESQVIKGMVFPREPEGTIKNIKTKSKVVVYTCPIDISTTETKGTVLLHNAQEMLDFTKGEEQQLDQMCKEISDSGVKVVIAGSSMGELALHYFNKYSILVLKVPSKFDLRRICQVCGATPLPRLGAPMPDEAGSIDIIETKELGGDRVTIFRQVDDSISRTATIIIRGATQNNLDDVERAIDDGVNSIKGLLKDNRLLPGAGAIEIELIKLITAYGESTPGLLQIVIKHFAKAFEIIPKVLADTSGLDASELLSKIYAAHSSDGLNFGIDIENDDVVDVRTVGIFDLLSAKKSAYNLAVETTNTILSIDQIIMAKRAGGPVMPKQNKPGNWDSED